MPDNSTEVKSAQPLSAELLETHGAAFLEVLRTATDIEAAAEKALREAGQSISIKEWDALAFAAAYGPIRPSDLLRKVVLTATPQTLSSIVDRLQERGLVSRSPHPDDSRSVLISITAEGQRVVEEVFPFLNLKLIMPFNIHYTDEELALIHELFARH